MSMCQQRFVRIVPFVVIPFLLILPQLITRNMILGSDALFHFNRFYDCAMQIKTGNFQYFASYYGFQQSARIVNAFYGPAFAYFQGGLVILAGTWFAYQVVANYVLYVVAMTTMALFLRKLRVSWQYSLLLSISSLATYAIQYWVMRQGFTSWGAAFFPLCLIPLVEFLESGHFPIRKSALALALMLQVHLFTALLVASVYFIAFCLQFLRSSQRIRLLKDVTFATILFFGLSSHFLGSILYLYCNNQLVAPFVNPRMDVNTITGNSYYWLLNPCWLVPFLLLGIYWWYSGGFVQRKAVLAPFFLGSGSFFVLLSSGGIPWKTLLATGNPIISLIQFPFRFFVPATVLLWGFLGIVLQRRGQKGCLALLILTSVAMIQALGLNFYTLRQWDNIQPFYGEVKHITVHKKDLQEVKRTFYSGNLAEALQSVTKATPDYLPQYGSKSKGKQRSPYEQYQQAIIDTNEKFQKRVVGSQLEITWQGMKNDWRDVPVVCYRNTQVRVPSFLGQAGTFRVTDSGTLQVKEHIGENKILLSFRRPPFFILSLVGSSLTFFFLWWSFLFLKKTSLILEKSSILNLR